MFDLIAYCHLMSSNCSFFIKSGAKVQKKYEIRKFLQSKVIFFEIAAVFGQAALVALRLASLADISAVKQQPVMGFGDDIRRYVLDELPFRLKGILAVGRESEPFADTENMRVHRHGRLVPDDCTDDVRGLAAYSLQRLQIIDVIGYDAVIHLNQPLCHLHQMFRFGARITDGLDVLKHFVRGGCG